MYRTIAGIAVIVIAVSPLTPWSKAQDPTSAPQSIELSAIVTDKKNNPVNTLNASEVIVKEDGKEVKVLGIEVDERPVDLAIMLDTSGSMRTQFNDLKDVVARIVKFKRPEDKIFLGRFAGSEHIDTVSDFTDEESRLLNPLMLLNVIGGRTVVIDALHFGATKIIQFNKGNARRRKVMVAITDGEDRDSLYKIKELTKLLHEGGVQVFVFGLTQELDEDAGLIRRSSKKQAEELLTSIATESGGRVLLPKGKQDFIKATTDIINHLRGQFLIKIELATSRPGFHRIEVKHKPERGDAHKVIVPRGYFVKS